MCTCASCEYTDGFSDKGFAAWPRGNPAGRRSSDASYAAHVRHSWSGSYKSVPFKPGQPPQFNNAGLVMPVTPAPKWLHDWINRKSPAAAEAAPASPDQPGKAEPHLAPGDRTARPSATIYEMAKEKAKRKPGRPALPGKIKRILVSLDTDCIERARKLGGGRNVSAGIRKALGGKS